MIIFCEPKNLIDLGDEDYGLYNLSSPVEKGIKLFDLVPPFSLEVFKDELAFDKEYSAYCLNRDKSFIAMFMPIFNLYDLGMDKKAIVLVKRDDIRDVVMDSLIKLWQLLYGIESHIINDIEDWDELKYDEVVDNFTEQGIKNFDKDKERYELLTVNNHAEV